MKRVIVIISIACFAGNVWADNVTTGEFGIKSAGLGLNGSGVVIGMVEKYHVGKPGKDLPQYVHTQVNPVEVYAGTSVDSANSQYVTAIDPLTGDIDSHATQVAGIMIASGVGNTNLRGIAPQASLYSGAVAGGLNDENFALAANRIAALPANPRVINVSFGREFQFLLEEGDGNAHSTQFVDWSARRHDVLYVFAGPEEGAQLEIPQDNFNGITVAASSKFQCEGAACEGEDLQNYRQVSSYNTLIPSSDAVGNRTTIDLMASGDEVQVTKHNNGDESVLGTSFAAPHVTGAAALLHQYAANQITAGTPRWGNEAHFHEVTKAILLNSADKLPGVHGSTREVVNRNNQNWLTTFASLYPEISLDEEMGAGHLNAEAALTNFMPGEYDPGSTPVPLIGWDFGSIGAFSSLDYTFDQTVSGYVAITLAWDRRVELTDPDNSYSFGDQFFRYNDISQTQNNLDVLLLNNLGQVVTSSTTPDDNLEHIFFDVPAGQYTIRIEHNGGIGDDQDYGLAWWAGEASSTIQPGDFNGDTRVNGLDFLAWQRGESPRGPLDAQDLADWQANYGFGALEAVTVPEPSSHLILMIGLTALLSRKRS